MTDAQLIAHVKKAEGWPRYTNDPHDPGGPTKGGITLDTFRSWRRNPRLTADDLKGLQESEANAIYQFDYVQPFAAVKDARLRHYLVDLGVLRGPRKAAQMAQEIVGVEADGWIGPVTLAAMEKPPFKAHLLAMLVGSRFTHIAARIRENPSQIKFRNGWRNRNLSFLL